MPISSPLYPNCVPPLLHSLSAAASPDDTHHQTGETNETGGHETDEIVRQMRRETGETGETNETSEARDSAFTLHSRKPNYCVSLTKIRPDQISHSRIKAPRLFDG